ncbi:MAG TPA: DUF4202 family protein [Thermoanaerobaculia bacterium]|jgi:hypothetical protein|nr:DUF4202 family protein [Thermoanaerobaculia bacterium]
MREAFPAREALAAEFPAVELRWTQDRGEVPSLSLAIEIWESRSFNFYDLDALLDDRAERTAGPFALLLRGEEARLPGFAREVLTRCQRLMDRRNAGSRSGLFDRVLAEHRVLHDLSKPLVRADYNHALDTWQWALRLEPEAGLAVQLAALFHDVERLVSEADARIEHHAANYQDFKDDHALRGAWMADQTLARAGVDEETRRRTARLIAEHERPPAVDDPEAGEIALLNDADALSFFSLNSAGYLEYYGPRQTRRKVEYTLRRLRPGSLRYLEGIRLRPQVAAAMTAAWERVVA